VRGSHQPGPYRIILYIPYNPTELPLFMYKMVIAFLLPESLAR
jgi:hypothetical protein